MEGLIDLKLVLSNVDENIDMDTAHRTINNILLLMFNENANVISKNNLINFIAIIKTFDELDLKRIIEDELDDVIVKINEEDEAEFAFVTIEKITCLFDHNHKGEDFIRFYELILDFDKLIDEVLINNYAPGTDFIDFFFDFDYSSCIPFNKKLSLATNTAELLKNEKISKYMISGTDPSRPKLVD